MSETREEYLFGQYYDRRVDFLRDLDIVDLIELFPSWKDAEEILIEIIIENGWDKQINDEVKWKQHLKSKLNLIMKKY